MVQDPEEKDRPSDAEAPGSANANEELGQSCQAIEDAKREGLVSSIQRGVQDPVLTVSDLEYILLHLHLKIANNRKKKCLSGDRCAGTANVLTKVVVTIKGMEIPDSRSQ